MTLEVDKPNIPTVENSVAEMIGKAYSVTPLASLPSSDETDSHEYAKFDFSEGFQTKIMVLCLRDLNFMSKVGHLIKPQYFDNAGEAALVDIAVNYYEQYKTLPGVKSAVELFKSAIATKKITSATEPAAKLALKNAYGSPSEGIVPDLSDAEFAATTVATFARHQEMTRAIFESVELLNAKKFDKIEAKIKTANAVGINEEPDEYEFFERIEERTDQRRERAAGFAPITGITTGLKQMDEKLYHQGWGKKELSVLMGGAKSGKCVTRNTLLFTEDGMVEIGDYVSASVRVGEFSEKVISVLGRNGLEKTSHVYNSGLSPTLRIETQKGYHIEGTLHHPMLVKSGNELVWKRLDELTIGDMMVIQRGAKVFGSNDDLSYAVTAGQKRIDSSKRQDAMTGVILPRKMTPELAEFMAMIISEGYLGKNGVIAFTQLDETILTRFIELTKLLFGLSAKVQRHSGKVPYVRVQNIALQAYLEALDVKWVLSAEKEIPRSIRSAPQESFVMFLNTLLGLEGHAGTSGKDKATFSLTMASEKLIDQIHIALLNFGIVSKKWQKNGCATNGTRIIRTYYRIDISGANNIKALREEIGLYEPRKQALLDAVSCLSKTGSDCIPKSGELIGKIMAEIQAAGLPLKSTFSSSMCRSLRTLRSGRLGERRELTYAFAAKLVSEIDRLEVTGDAANTLREFVRLNYYFDPVVGITAHEAQTVDLTVPTTHSFFANGLVSHNTTAMINFAKAGSLAGKNVLYVTLEVSKDIIAMRMDASISSTFIKELTTSLNAVRAKVLDAAATAGALKIAEFPPNSFKPSDLQRLIDSYKSPKVRKDGTIREPIKFDMVVVDYADIMAPNHRNQDTIENSRNIWLDLRAIAVREDVAMLSATQTNREGFKSSVAKAEHVADDFNKVRTVDLMISINATDEERAEGTCRLYFAASRNQEGGFTIHVKQDLAKMIFASHVLRVE